MALDTGDLQQKLKSLKESNLYRSRRIVESVEGNYVQIDGRKVLNFCSNDYLGLANHQEVINRFKSAADEHGVGSGSAHLVCGHSAEHHALEEELAEFTGRDRALLFSTGYMANLGVIAGLMSKGDVVYQDKLNHASLIDGSLLAGAVFSRYLHNDLANLSVKMQKHQGKQSMIVTDGVFSMDGDQARVAELSEVAQQKSAYLMIDDAHGFGVLGNNGAGIVERLNLNQEQVPLLVGTFGKAFGTSGAFVVGSDAMIETLIQKARTYIYTTALPPAIAAATRCSLSLMQTESWRREQLHYLINYFKEGASQLALPLMPSETAIQPLLLGGNTETLTASESLFQRGFWVTAIRAPTVPKGSARLRITLSAEHTVAQIDQLLDALKKIT
ncbi:MAG: 8-amino-7-oxononanoate synthase [Methyloprofundus sp.]|nr:8-amino-7-oxononanoate synthase [Methyloprofundus sp.]